jgi:hypothetical protein
LPSGAAQVGHSSAIRSYPFTDLFTALFTGLFTDLFTDLFTGDPGVGPGG